MTCREFLLLINVRNCNKLCILSARLSSCRQYDRLDLPNLGQTERTRLLVTLYLALYPTKPVVLSRRSRHAELRNPV